jgi:hypothetical protein
MFRLVFVMYTQDILCEVGTEFIYIYIYIYIVEPVYNDISL